MLDSGLSGPGSSPGRGHCVVCVVFLGKTLYFHSHLARMQTLPLPLYYISLSDGFTTHLSPRPHLSLFVSGYLL